MNDNSSNDNQPRSTVKDGVFTLNIPSSPLKDRPSIQATRTLSTDLNPTEATASGLETMSLVAGSIVGIESAENTAQLRPTPENYIDLSLAYYQAGRFHECIAASHKALGLRPKYAEAHNNISAAYQLLGDWDAAITAARNALRIAPNYRLAKNNLALALEKKRLSQ
jgi:tetratricopeptide (TPR) repeat protein